MCILATDHQLDDLVRFCTDPIQFAVLCIDPTFCIGDFNVTPIVFKYLLLESRRYGTPPIIHGPILVHQKKEFASYHYFLSTLIGLRPHLKAVQAFGSDGEESLVQALKSCFPWAQQLRCFLHMRRNIKAKLNELNVSSASKSIILVDIFGKNDGTNFQEGLVDAASEGLFYSQLESVEKKWNELELIDSKCEPKFFNWFQKYESSVFATAMIKPKREAAGLGLPAAEFTTNACESGHFALKNYLPSNGQCSWQDFVQKSLQFVKDQQREIEIAVLNRGQYQFKKQYSSLILGDKWFKLNSAQQEAHLKKIHSQKLCSPFGEVENSLQTASKNDAEVLMPPKDNATFSSSKFADDGSKSGPSGTLPKTYFSVSCEEFLTQVQLPQSTVLGIWEKATSLIASGTSIVHAPGMQNAWYVESNSKQMPHLVRVSPKGSIACDKVCEHYRSISICSHTVAIAHKIGSLKEFTKSYIKKKGHHSPNLGNFALTGMPAGRNRKGNAPPRKRFQKTPSSLLPHLPLDASKGNSVEGNRSCGQSSSSGASSEDHSMFAQLYSPPPTPGYFQPASQQPIAQYQQNLAPVFSPYGPTVPATPFLLKFLNHMLKVCAGCRGGYSKKADGSLLDPPYDICVSHETVITLTNPVDKSPFKKPTKEHFHAHPSCIFMVYPAFNPAALVVPPQVTSKLTEEHWEYLFIHFGITQPV